MSNVIVNVEIVVQRDDRFLMILRSEEEEHGGGWLCFPGGKLDPGTAEMHALELTARRELKEEVDLDVEALAFRYVESHTFLIGDKTVLDIVLLTDSVQGVPKAIDPAEVAEVTWMTVDEIMTDPRVQPFTRESLRLALAACNEPA
ncbi:MAG TPA: NUDIX hydrolase [Thermomicrobiales bacterium]|nr:NUDIX hydrolase [Thermomicrobiales bacterium]